MMMTMLLLVTLAANAQSEVYAYIVDASGTPHRGLDQQRLPLLQIETHFNE